MTKHAAAIDQLERSAEICETNAPIHEAEGNAAQAQLSRANATAYREAAAVLKAHAHVGEVGQAVEVA